MRLKGLIIFPIVCLTLFFSSLMAQSLPPAENTTPQQEVSDKDLALFIEINKKREAENEKLQQEWTSVMEEIITKGGMTVERFNEVYYQDHNTQPDIRPDISEEEQEQMSGIMLDVQKAQDSFQEKVAEIIEDNGMSIEKYEAIVTELQQNQKLQMKLAKLMQD